MVRRDDPEESSGSTPSKYYPSVPEYRPPASAARPPPPSYDVAASAHTSYGAPSSTNNTGRRPSAAAAPNAGGYPTGYAAAPPAPPPRPLVTAQGIQHSVGVYPVPAGAVVGGGYLPAQHPSATGGGPPPPPSYPSRPTPAYPVAAAAPAPAGYPSTGAYPAQAQRPPAAYPTQPQGAGYPTQPQSAGYPTQPAYPAQPPSQYGYPAQPQPAYGAYAGAAAVAPGLYDPTYAHKVEQAVGANVRMLGACKDSQTAADVHNVAKFGTGASGSGGACTNALLRAVQQGPTTWIGLLRRMQGILKQKGMRQVPQLSTSRILDLNAPFEMMQPGGGRHRSLLIGINYVGQRNELRGCHNDVIAMKQYIMSQGFSDSPQHMCVLADDRRHSQPTLANITNAFRWLVDGARPGDSLFFHYSGHGGRVRDDNGDEADGYDETILPLDFQRAGQIRDDDIFKLLVKPLPPGVEFTIVMDCCHSGTIIDLPYSLSCTDQLIHAMDAGQAPMLQPNSDFNFKKMVGVGLGMLMGGKHGKDAMNMLGLNKLLKKL